MKTEQVGLSVSTYKQRMVFAQYGDLVEFYGSEYRIIGRIPLPAGSTLGKWVIQKIIEGLLVGETIWDVRTRELHPSRVARRGLHGV